MDDPLTRALVRIAPFALILFVFSIRLAQGRLSAQALSLSVPRSPQAFFGWWAGFCMLIAATELLLFHLGLLETNAWRHDGLPAILRIVGMILLAPVAEELLFRGVLINVLSKRLNNDHVAILVQSALFVAVHSFTYDNSLISRIGVAQTLVDAILYGYARKATGSLLTPIVMHMTGNSVAVLEMMLLA